MKKLPLILTLSRIIVVLPLAALLFFAEKYQIPWMNWLSVVLFIAASITDYYDGYYARKLNVVSNLGKFLDPVADKILVTSILVVLLAQGRVDIWSVILFVGRDTLIGGIRAAASADGLVIAAQTTGKWKAAMQMIAIPLLMVNFIELPFSAHMIGYVILWLSVILSMLSGWQYIQLYLNGKKQV